MTTAPEIRTFSTALELRDVEVTGRPARYLEGRAVPYDTWGDVGLFIERHAAGSFKKSTTAGSGKRAPLLLFHDNRSFPIGHAEEWRHDDGLAGVWKLNGSEESERAADAAAAGDLVGLSVGFMDAAPPQWDYLDWDAWDPALGPDHKDRVTRVESRLVEVSMTPTPVFADAGVTNVRTAYGVHEREARFPRPVPQVDRYRQILDALRSGPSD